MSVKGDQFGDGGSRRKHRHLKHRIAYSCWLNIFHLIYFRETLSGRLFLPPRNALRDEDKPINLWESLRVKCVGQKGEDLQQQVTAPGRGRL